MNIYNYIEMYEKQNLVLLTLQFSQLFQQLKLKKNRKENQQNLIKIKNKTVYVYYTLPIYLQFTYDE